MELEVSPLDLILSQINPVHPLTPYSFKISNLCASGSIPGSVSSLSLRGLPSSLGGMEVKRLEREASNSLASGAD
jgi:hypothetical protein